MSQEEAGEVHKMLEEFRDEVNEEKVLRRLKKKGTASEGSVQRLLFCLVKKSGGVFPLSQSSLRDRGKIRKAFRHRHSFCSARREM